MLFFWMGSNGHKHHQRYSEDVHIYDRLYQSYQSSSADVAPDLVCSRHYSAYRVLSTRLSKYAPTEDPV